MLSNTRTVRIEWSHCDPAGIVFYPRYFAIFDTSTTALFERALGMSKYEFLKFYDFLGYPMVDMRSRFLLPTRFGDEVVIDTAVVDIRRSSFDISHRLLKNGELAVEAFDTRVWVVRDPNDANRIKAQPIPKEIVDKLSAAA
jgi:4-hydroxybenzoyl-CoA thioesterase